MTTIPRSALALALTASSLASVPGEDVYFEPAGRRSFIMREQPPRRASKSQHGKGKRRAKNKAARKARKQQRRGR